jgi:hypothetical protein
MTYDVSHDKSLPLQKVEGDASQKLLIALGKLCASISQHDLTGGSKLAAGLDWSFSFGVSEIHNHACSTTTSGCICF